MPARTSIAIHVILAALLLPPLHYYLIGGDKRDERFAWRMFSPVRSEACGTQFLMGQPLRPVKMSSEFHNAWVGVAQRGRKQVIAAMAQKLCADNPSKPVHVRVLCEEYPNSTIQNRRLLYDHGRTESDEQVELVAQGTDNFCATGVLR